MQWTPFHTIRGHRMQLDALTQLAQSQRHGHAYLFEGPDGVGKRQAARAFLARLACQGATGDEACGSCASCAALQRGTHPDLAEVTRDGQFIKIDQVRDATARLRYDPVQGRIKGLILDGAETLIEAAANALLKTLEEPPPDTVFVLVSSKPQLLIETIRSRCQVLRFAELPAEDVSALLQAQGIDREIAGVAAALADGSVSAAHALCHPDKLAVIDMIAMYALQLDLQPGPAAATMTEQLAMRMRGAGDDEAESETPRAKADTRAEFGRAELVFALDALRAVLRDAMVVACGARVGQLAYARHKTALEAMAQRVDPEAIAAVLQMCQELEARLVYNPTPRLAWTNLLVEAGRRLGGQRR